MCIKEIFCYLALFQHFMIFHLDKLVLKSIVKRIRTHSKKANEMCFESVQTTFGQFKESFLQEKDS